MLADPCRVYANALKLSRQQLKGTREARTDADRAEVPSISRQNPVGLPAFSDGGHRPVDMPQPVSFEFELGVEVQRSRKSGWESNSYSHRVAGSKTSATSLRIAFRSPRGK